MWSIQLTLPCSLQDWLQNVGSPGSRIDKLDTTEEDIPHATYDSFNVRRD